MIYDLHCHTTASDGALSPEELVRRATAKGVNVLAITDHDTTSGLQAATQAAAELELRLISGIEFSSQWSGRSVHILGLNIDVDAVSVVNAENQQCLRRDQRAEKIAHRLEKKGFNNVWASARQYAGEGVILSCVHMGGCRHSTTYQHR